MRKDVLEMLLRLFDREDLQLIPSLEFAAPLPELEAPAAAAGRGGRRHRVDRPRRARPGGRTTPRAAAWPPITTPWTRASRRRCWRVVRELAGRYAQHRSLAGLALRLSAYGYAQLPGPEWGMDDGTIARFQHDTRLQVPGEGPGRFAARAAFLNGDEHRAALAAMAGRSTPPLLSPRPPDLGGRPSRRTALPGRRRHALRARKSKPICGPSCRRKNTLADSLLQAGIDLRQYQEDRGVVLLRPERIVPGGRLNAQAVDLEINQMPDADPYFRGLPCPGSLFFHPPAGGPHPLVRSEEPAPGPRYAWLNTQSAPSAARNRQRFIHSLAVMDSQVLIDGGWLLSMGQEESLARPGGDLSPAAGGAICGGRRQPGRRRPRSR